MKLCNLNIQIMTKYSYRGGRGLSLNSYNLVNVVHLLLPHPLASFFTSISLQFRLCMCSWTWHSTYCSNCNCIFISKSDLIFVPLARSYFLVQGPKTDFSSRSLINLASLSAASCASLSRAASFFFCFFSASVTSLSNRSSSGAP